MSETKFYMMAAGVCVLHAIGSVYGASYLFHVLPDDAWWTKPTAVLLFVWIVLACVVASTAISTAMDKLCESDDEK